MRSYDLSEVPFHSDNIHESCIDQTVVKDVPVKKNGTIRPLLQVEAGVVPANVLCPECVEEVFIRLSDGNPYRVTPPLTEKLIKRGWERKTVRDLVLERVRAFAELGHPKSSDKVPAKILPSSVNITTTLPFEIESST